MYELIQVSDCCYYINCPAKIGVYLQSDNNVYLIDSGNDKGAGRKVKQILEQKGWQLQGILNTHSHADHIGGNHYLQKQTGCKVFAGGVEASFTKYPILEPAFLYGGCPPKDLCHKFILAQDSKTTDFTDADFPKEVEIIPLPGHCLDMSGFRLPDGSVFLADCVSSQTTLDKYAITFIYDVQAYLDTLDQIEKMEASVFIPSHAEVTKDVTTLTQSNRKKVWEITEHILEICSEPLNFDSILQKLFKQYELVMNFEQHALVGSTIRSYLAWLKDSQKLSVDFVNQLMVWQTLKN